MKRILNFKGFVNESKLNEGGGAGVNFKIDEVTLSVTYTMTKDGLTVDKVETSMSDTFDASGYDDGMNEVGSWLLKIDDSAAKNVKRSELAGLPLSMFHRDGLQDLMKETVDLGTDSGSEESELDEEELEKKYKTIEDLFKGYPDLDLEIRVDMKLKEFENTMFGGWVRGDIEEGDIVIDGNKYDTGDYDSMTLNGIELYAGNQEIAGFMEKIAPVLKAGKRFPEFWRRVFRDNSEDYKAYVKDELEYHVTEDEFDDEIETYLESNEVDLAGVTLEDFKKDYKEKYSEDFLEYWMDNKNEYFWDTYQSGLRDDYAPDNNPDEEQ